jgi:hypothetical protein
MPLKQRREPAVSAKRRLDLKRVGAEIEHAPRLLDGRGQRADPSEAQPESQVSLPRHAFELYDPGLGIAPDRAPISGVSDLLDARYGARGEEPDDRLPGERGPEREPQDEPFHRGSRAAKLGRGSPEGGADRLVESADAAEPRRHRHVGHRELGLVDQHACQLHAPGAGDRERGSAQVRGEEPPELSLADAEAASQLADRVRIEEPLRDQPERPGDGRRAAQPLGAARCGLRATPPARAEPGCLTGRSRCVEADVLALRHRRRTDRAAVDARRHDADEEPSVEAGIAALDRLPARVEIVDHEAEDSSGHPRRLAGFGLHLEGRVRVSDPWTRPDFHHQRCRRRRRRGPRRLSSAAARSGCTAWAPSNHPARSLSPRRSRRTPR